ncbi:mammalian cell entry protein [Mycobacterium sp. E796]|nr:mammalian cell entry protein [Mycobacterium sp. E796]
MHHPGGDSTEDNAEGETDPATVAPRARRSLSRVQQAVLIGIATVVTLAAAAGWFGFRIYQLHQADEQRELFVQVARQGAVNLTTIDWQHVDTDVKRIVDSATGTFQEDFAARSKPFIDVVKKVQSKSVGTVIGAGLESMSGNDAQVMVAMSVKTTMVNQPEQQPHSWRMRVSVHKDGDEVKVSDVKFVP